MQRAKSKKVEAWRCRGRVVATTDLCFAVGFSFNQIAKSVFAYFFKSKTDFCIRYVYFKEYFLDLMSRFKKILLFFLVIH